MIYRALLYFERICYVYIPDIISYYTTPS